MKGWREDGEIEAPKGKEGKGGAAQRVRDQAARDLAGFAAGGPREPVPQDTQTEWPQRIENNPLVSTGSESYRVGALFQSDGRIHC